MKILIVDPTYMSRTSPFSRAVKKMARALKKKFPRATVLVHDSKRKMSRRTKPDVVLNTHIGNKSRIKWMVSNLSAGSVYKTAKAISGRTQR